MADIAQEAGVVADEPVLIGLSKLLSYLWNVVWQHAPGTIDGDADALHDMRVAIRRLRSLLENFEGSKTAPLLGSSLRRELRDYRSTLGRIGDALGAVRDQDVLDDYLKEYAKKRLKCEVAASPGLAVFERYLQNERAAAFGPMVKRLNKSRSTPGLREEFARFALGLPAADAPPMMLQDAARQLLPARIDEVLSHREVLNDPLNVDAHHDLRKTLRRVRYTLETLAPCFNEPVKPHIKTLVQLQDVLGEMQDRTVLAENARRAFGIKHEAEDALPEDVTEFLRYGEARRRRLLMEARKQWNDLLERNFFDTLRSL